MSNLVIVLIAVIPAIALMIFIYFQDKHEKEPISLLLKIFFLGVLSVIPTIIGELLVGKMVDITFGGTYLIYHAMTAFFGVGIIEEGFKFLAAYLCTWRNKKFNYKFDGIVYCLFGSMGFAATENIMYLFRANAGFVLRTGISRGLLAIPAHAMCAIFMGYYYGNAKYLKSYGDRAGCRANLIRGFVIASSLHAFYDFCIMTQSVIFSIIFVVFVIVADVFTIRRVIMAKKEDEKMYEAPQYRQYWVAANPYQPYGGYQAPTYGGYTAPNQGSPYQPQGAQGGQPMGQSPYQPQGMPVQGMPQQNQGMPEPQMQQPVMPEPDRDMLIRCPVCGEVNSFKAFFCRGCGASLHQL
ncbi:MAG: PrsW family intramembrane metalloprotease [Eubacterium sp.]|nr:PrsW family intramembrane metalloprotease [Eubacterium sp.]